ncbi:unnamed protein product, partial [Penicillium nalgiovense]
HHCDWSRPYHLSTFVPWHRTAKTSTPIPIPNRSLRPIKMAGSKRNPPTNRGKQPTIVLEDDESHKQETVAALNPNTPTPDPQRLVNTSEYDEEDESPIRERLHRTPSKERFYKLARDHKKLKDKI